MLPGTNLSNFLGVITNRQGRKLLVAQMGSILRSISLYPMDTNSIQNKDSCLSDGGPESIRFRSFSCLMEGLTRNA